MAALKFGPDAQKKGDSWLVPISEVIIDPTLNTSRAYDPRVQSKATIEALVGLGESMLKYGQEAPSLCDIVRGKPRIRVGFRRGMAMEMAKANGMAENPMLLITVMPDDVDWRALNREENRERENQTPMDVAAMCEAMRIGDEANGIAPMSQKEIAAALKVKEAYVSKHLAFLKAPEKVQRALANGHLSESAAYYIFRLKDKREETLAAMMEQYSLTEEDLDKPAAEVAKSKAKASNGDEEEEIPELPSGKAGKPDKDKKPTKKGKTSKSSGRNGKGNSKPGMMKEDDAARAAAKVGAKKAPKDKKAAETGAPEAGGVTRRVSEIRETLLGISEGNSAGKWEKRLADRMLAYIGSVIDADLLMKEFGKCCKVSESAAKAAAEA